MANIVVPPSRQYPNDEPVYEDYLGHHSLAKQLGERICVCDAPYVLGVLGSWGSGKTSFLRKIWAYLGGDTPHTDDDLRRWFGDGWQRNKNVHPIWFNPWQHQFEASPMVALLYEIRRSLSFDKRFLEEAKKLANVTVYSALSLLGDLGDALPKLDVTKIEDRGKKYEAEHFAEPLSSQRFRDIFEAAIGQAIGKKKRMVVFIDDLDRCESEVAYRLLESVKLYLNAKNCAYVLGLDQKHLEETIARVLSHKEDHWRHRALAREYLGKMFQCQFLLPVTPDMRDFIREVLQFGEESPLRVALKDGFGVLPERYADIVEALNACLPHNPRKIKAFIAAWKLYIVLLVAQDPAASFDWRLTLALNYLGQFEEPLYRKVEESPGFFPDEIVRFCQTGAASSQHRALFDGLELPYGSLGTGSKQESSGSESFSLSREPLAGDIEREPSPAARTFWIRELVVTLYRDAPQMLERESVGRHLLRARLG
jgi:hypothetical protein